MLCTRGSSEKKHTRPLLIFGSPVDSERDQTINQIINARLLWDHPPRSPCDHPVSEQSFQHRCVRFNNKRNAAQPFFSPRKQPTLGVLSNPFETNELSPANLQYFSVDVFDGNFVIRVRKFFAIQSNAAFLDQALCHGCAFGQAGID